MSDRCHALIPHGKVSVFCLKPAKMEHNGKHYCNQHDPVKRKAKAAAVKVKHVEFRDSQNAKEALRDLEARLLREVIANGDDRYGSYIVEAQPLLEKL
jgi:hypothetical protein